MVTSCRMFVIIFQLLFWFKISLQNSIPTVRTKTTPTTIDPKELQRQEEYDRIWFKFNADYGYEPYWVDGGWVLTTTTPNPLDPTTYVPEVCGEPCPTYYRSLMEVCVREAGEQRFLECVPTPMYKNCRGLEQPKIVEFKTYKTYCEFLAEECKMDFTKDKRLVFVHLGACKTENENFKSFYDRNDTVSRMHWYYTSFHDAERIRNSTLRAPIWLDP